MSFLEGLQFSLAIALGLFLSYRMMLAVLALFRKDVEHFDTAKNRKFAVVLLAKSDESIARSLYSLSGMVYPKNLYELIVVTDNDLNESIATAKKLGVTVLVTDTKQDPHSELDLPWVFEQILRSDTQQNYDAVIIFNKDNLVAGNYLEVMNYYLEKGDKVIQGGYKALPMEKNWKGKIARIEFLMHHYVFLLGNNILGFPAALKSNGSCFATTVLRKYAWQNLSTSNEVELGFMMQQEGIEIEFAPEAVIFVDIPTKVHACEDKNDKLLKNISLFFKDGFILNKSNRLPIILTMYPTVIQVLVFVILMAAISVGTWIFGITSPLHTGIWLGVAAIGMGQLYVGLKMTDVEEEFLKTLLYAPAYAYCEMKYFLQLFWAKKIKSTTKKTPNDSCSAVNDTEEIVQ